MSSNMNEIKSYRMWLACTLANLGYLIFGLCIAWPSPMMPRLRDHTSDSPLAERITKDEEGWIGSLIAVGALIAKLAEEEMARIQKAVDADMMNKGGFADIFKSQAYRKAFFISTGLQTFKKLSGVPAVTFNSQTIFTSAESTIDPRIAAIILALTQLVANLITPFVIDRAGRKLILMISAIGMCLSFITLGTFFYIQAFGDASSILWIPIPCLMIFYAMFAVGFEPIPNVIIGEILPLNIKSTVSSTATTLNWVTTFLVTRWYPELNALGLYIVFWVFGGFCALAFIFVVLFVIETKGLNLQEIQQKLQVS